VKDDTPAPAVGPHGPSVLGEAPLDLQIPLVEPRGTAPGKARGSWCGRGSGGHPSPLDPSAAKMLDPNTVPPERVGSGFVPAGVGVASLEALGDRGMAVWVSVATHSKALGRQWKTEGSGVRWPDANPGESWQSR